MAIAFYNQNRLLPARHQYLQKAVDQRNQDARDMREYVGRAATSVGDMMERTGKFYGMNLSDTQDPSKPGGTLAKEGWQKGVMDDENKRRTVTHRLGLLMEHMKAGNLDRKARAWKGNDEATVSKQFDNRFKIFSEHIGTMPRADLIGMYPDMYSKAARKHYDYINAIEDEKDRNTKLDEFNRDPKFAPFMDYKKWAQDGGMYDPSVYSEPFEGLTMLTNYLRKEVGFDIGGEDSKQSKPTPKSQLVANEEGSNEGGTLEDNVKTVIDKRISDKKTSTTPSPHTEKKEDIYTGGTQSPHVDAKPDSPNVKDFAVDSEGKPQSTLNQVMDWGTEYIRWANKHYFGEPVFEGTEAGGRSDDPKKVKKVTDEIKKEIVKSNLKQDEVQIALKNLDAIFESKLGIPLVDLRQGWGFGKGYEGDWADPRSEGGSKWATEGDIAERKEEVANEALIAPGGAFYREMESIDTTSTAAQMTPKKVMRNTRLLEDNRKPGYKLTNDSAGKSSAGYLIDDKGGRPILPGGVNLNYHLSNKENKLELANRVIDLMGGIPKGSKQRAMLLEYATSSVADLKKTFGYARGGKKLTPKQEAARRAIKLTPDQVDNLVTHTWVDHLSQFSNEHPVIGQNSTKVYNDNPYLKHLVGDMAYRLGPYFTRKEKWEGFKEGMKQLINSTDESGKLEGLKLMKESFAKNYPRDHMDRFDYLNDRLNKMNGWITRGRYAGKGTENITLYKADNLPTPKTKYTGKGNTLILNWAPVSENQNAGYQQVGE